jgi:hypothetical protein
LLGVVAVRIDVRPYRDVEPRELEEWKRLVKKANPPGETRLGSDLRPTSTGVVTAAR